MNRSTAHDNLARIGSAARRAANAGNWDVVRDCAREIQRLDKRQPEGWFLIGLLENASGSKQKAFAAFTKALQLDSRRYDAAVELAALCESLLRNREAVALLKASEPRLGKSAYYLDMAGAIYSRLGLHSRAWPLYLKANELQPDIDHFQLNLASCAASLGKIDRAIALRKALLTRHPDKQRNHFEFSRLQTATDRHHVEQMKQLLETSRLPPDKSVFLYYAIAKELEDLQSWEEAFTYYELANDAAAEVARRSGYEAGSGIDLIDSILEACDSEWLNDWPLKSGSAKPRHTPIFIVGLPRTGITLMERILASHSYVGSAGETSFMESAIRRAAGFGIGTGMTPEIIRTAAGKQAEAVGQFYSNFIEFRLGGLPKFIDACPLNILYLGFIAKGLPQAKIVILRRNPMDSCLALYQKAHIKQAFSLEDIGHYYLAFDRLCRHWTGILPDRVIEVSYENLVADKEGQTRKLLDKLGLEFEPACLDFHLKPVPGATAGEARLLEQANTASLNRWKKFEKQLQPLKELFGSAGLSTGSG